MSDGQEKNQVNEEEPVAAAPARHYRRRAGDAGRDEAGAPIWLITFTDVMGLMLTFFVLIFSMSEPTTEGWKEMSAALDTEFNKFQGGQMNRGPTDAQNTPRIDFDDALNIRYLEVLFDSALAENEKLSGVKVISLPGQIILSLPQDLLFDPGQAAIKEEGAKALYALGGTLARIRNKIEVIGHADPRPVKGTYDSNWTLSLMRGSAVAGLLNSVGYERDIDVKGFSSGRFDDLRDAMPDMESRMDLSRRVDIVIMDHDGRRKERLFDIQLP